MGIASLSGVAVGVRATRLFVCLQAFVTSGGYCGCSLCLFHVWHGLEVKLVCMEVAELNCVNRVNGGDW